MKDISHRKLLLYDSTLGQIVIHGFNNEFEFDLKNLYYFRQKNKRLNDLTGTYLKLEPIKFYYETEQGLKWSVFSVDNIKKIKAKSVIMVRFKITGVYYSLEKLLSNSILKGFSRVIDDNNYFSAIPIINELVHWDNGVIVSNNHTIEKVYSEKWDSVTLTTVTRYDGEPVIKMTGGSGHQHL